MVVRGLYHCESSHQPGRDLLVSHEAGRDRIRLGDSRAIVKRALGHLPRRVSSASSGLPAGLTVALRASAPAPPWTSVWAHQVRGPGWFTALKSDVSLAGHSLPDACMIGS